MNVFKKILSLFILTTFLGCAGTGIQTNPNNPNPESNPTGNLTTPESFGNASVNLNVFSLGGDFPPDIQIPDLPGMEDTAFIVTFFPPAVLPLNLDSKPLSLSEAFSIFDASGVAGTVFPNNVELVSTSLAFLLGDTGIAIFNPSTGALLGTQSLVNPVTLSQSLPYSLPGDCNLDSIPETSVGPGPFSPNFPSDMAVFGDRLFVTMSNGCFDASFESFYIQGLLLVFDINPSPPFLTPASTPFIILPGFNATGITILNDRMIVTSTGDTSLSGAKATPQTDSFLAEIDPLTLSITNLINLGLVAANFQPLAITSDESRGFIGSSAFSEVYEINLDNFTIVRGKDDPIPVFNVADDFISDQEMPFGDQVLFVSSFNQSGVRGIDLTGGAADLLPTVLDFSFAGSPGVTGAGPMALRPGQPNVDFTGPDLWILTGSPGTVSNATTY